MSNYAPQLIITNNQETWPENDHNFWNKVSNIIDKGFEENKKTFKTWFPVQRIPIYTPSFGIVETAYIGDVLSYLKQNYYPENWMIALEESKVGHNEQSYEAYTTKLTKRGINVSAWSVKSASHLMKFLNVNDLQDFNRYDNIIELGAGIGEIPRMLKSANIFNGKYTIVDLPAIAKISKYYNDENNVDVNIVTDLDSFVLPEGKTLIIGTWSINEMPVEQRTKFLQKAAGSDFLMIYSLHILGMNNAHYYASDFVKITGSPITHMEFIPSHPYDGGNYYLFCVS